MAERFCVRILLFITFFLLFSPHVMAETDAERTEKELQAIQEKIKSLVKQIDQKKVLKNKEQKQLRSIEKKLSRTQSVFRATRHEIKKNRKQLNTLKKNQAGLKKSIHAQKISLAQQLRVAHMSGNQAHLKILLNQENTEQVSRIQKYFGYLNKARIQQISDFQKSIAEMKALNEAIVLKNRSLEKLLDKQKAQIEVIEASRTQRKTVLNQIKALLKKDGAKLKQLKRNEKSLSDLLTSLTDIFRDIPDLDSIKKPFKTLKGKLPWPITAKPLNSFGAKRSQGDLKWNGLMFRIKEGKEVKAISGGRVAFAEWLQGFGQLVIIDHDDGYLSLYGHNQMILKEVGDWVKPKDTIALTGNSGGIEQPALYFEIRHKGKPINPTIWCKK